MWEFVLWALRIAIVIIEWLLENAQVAAGKVAYKVAMRRGS